MKDEYQNVITRMEGYLAVFDTIAKDAFEIQDFYNARKATVEAIRLTHTIMNFKAAFNPSAEPGPAPGPPPPPEKKDLPS